MSKPDFEAMTKAQLSEYAAETYGVDLDSALPKVELVAQLERLAAADAPPEPKAPATVATEDGEQRLDITIHQQNGEDGDEDVTVQVNGYMIQIKRGQRVSVPARYVHALENAVASEYRTDPKTRETVRRDVPRFAFTVHGPSA